LPTIVGALLIALSVLLAGRGVSRTINRSTKQMSEAVTTALDRLTTDVSNVITDVAQALRDAAGSADDTPTADAINAQAKRLEDLDATLHSGGGPVTEPAPEPAPEPPPEG
jgi:ABC-type transporter Mla subunit MlaD